MSELFTQFKIRSLTFPNRIGMPPMCMYSYQDGVVSEFQRIHLGARAMGGVGLIIAEATAVNPKGRITAYDAGIWTDEQAAELAKTASTIKHLGAVAAIQLAHAGRKASTRQPWAGGSAIFAGEDNGWQPIGPSPLAFDAGYATPTEMSLTEIDRIVDAFGSAAKRALAAGFQVVEVHAAHGYLLHSFLSPISNKRTDEYGGSHQNRERFLLRVVERIRTVWPTDLPLFVRLSCTDWIDGGWAIEDSVHLAGKLKDCGVDLIDCSSGGIAPKVQIPVGPGYQVRFAAEIRQKAGIATAAVGLISEAKQAEEIIASGQADLVLLGRKLLSDPFWPIWAAKQLGDQPNIPVQYQRGLF